ncbi:MAG: hypothetical protein RJQ00_02660 [Vicingaceae bacterium]
MKKLVFLPILFLGFTLVAAAQSRDPSPAKSTIKEIKINSANQFIRLYFGYAASVTLGDYAETDFSNIESGFAENGRRLRFGLHFNLKIKNFLTFEYNSFSHPIDAVSLFNGSGISSQQYNVDDYSIGIVAFGYKYVSFISKDVDFYINPFIGIGTMQVGRYSFTVPVQGGTATILQEAERSVESFVYGFNGGVEFWLTDVLNLSLNLGLITSEFEINSKITEQINGVIVSTQVFSYNQPFSALNAGVSIGYNF